jgi:hypothetical protein
MSEILLDQWYPDALGSISRGLRSDLDGLQAVLGVFPRQAFLNQPLELVLLLQNMVDQPTQVRVTLMLPPLDKKGMPLVLDTPKQQISADLQGGEVGVLRIPIMALPPTQPGTDIPAQVTISHRSGRGARTVRSRAGGVPPSSFTVSQFKLQALRDVSFTVPAPDAAPNVLTTYFDIAPKRLEIPQYSLKPRYETLWTANEMSGEREMVQTKIEEARAYSITMTSTALYWAIYYATEEHWARRGVRLGEGELKAITKILTYTMSEATVNERGFSLANSRWFQTLCYALLAEPHITEMDPGTVAAQYLYDAAVYDAVVLGFRIMQSRTAEKLGSEDERRAYAEKLVGWLGGYGQAELSYLYLPLVMAGLAINALVGATTENPWVLVQQLQADVAIRAEGANKSSREIISMVTKMLTNAENELTRMNYSRPVPEE